MSVIMALRAKGDPQKLESLAGENPARVQGILERRSRTASSPIASTDLIPAR